MSLNRVTLALQQSDFQQKHTKTLLKCIFFLLIIAYILSGIILYQHFTRSKAQYFISTLDGQLIAIEAS